MWLCKEQERAGDIDSGSCEIVCLHRSDTGGGAAFRRPVDDLGWGDLGCTGHPHHKTPHLDRMAAEGTRFTDFYMASPVCSSSRGAMLTGCYPRRIGFGSFEGKAVLLPGQPVGLSTDETTIAGMLKHQGYSTRIIGKWHCGDQPEFLPTRHGFDGYYGIPYSNDMGRQVELELVSVEVTPIDPSMI